MRWGTQEWADEKFEEAKKSNESYKDKVWPVGTTRTGEMEKKTDTSEKYKNGFKQDGYLWKRGTDIAAHMKRGSKACLAANSDKFDVLDVNQGSSNTGFLLASMASLAERRPDLLKKCFLKKDIEKGVYMMKFYGCSYHGQEECVVLMDDVIAMNKNRPIELNYCQPKGYGKGKKKKVDLEMWPVLMEEAYCKIIGGNFKENDGGSMQVAITNITGMQGQVIQKYSFDDQTFERFKEMDAGDIFCALTPGTAKKGLMPNQSYSILEWKEVDGLKLIKLRNPYGTRKGEWTGDYGDKSSKWKKRLRKKIGFEDKGNDGIFWMTSEDFASHFKSYTWSTEYQSYALGKASQDIKELFSVEKRVLEKGDKVLCQKPSSRSMEEKLWYMGTIVSANKQNKTAKIKYELDSSEEDGVVAEEIFYAPHGPFNRTIGANVRYNEVQKVVNYGFWTGSTRLAGKVQPVEFVLTKKKTIAPNNNNNNNGGGSGGNSPWGGGNSEDQQAREEKRKKQLLLQAATEEEHTALTRLKSILATPGAATDGRCWLVLGAVFNERSAHLHFLRQSSAGPPPAGWQLKFITQVQQQLVTVLHGDTQNLLAGLGKHLFGPLLGWNLVTRSPIAGRPAPNYAIIDSFLSRAKKFCADQENVRKRQRLESVEPTKEELNDIAEACDRLWDLDADLRLKPGKDYQINLQRTGNQSRDSAPDDLFTWVNDEKLNSTAVFAKFVPLLDNYEFEPGKAEHHDNAVERREVSEFLDACLNTACIRYIYKWLVLNKRFSGNYKSAFKKKLQDLWFNGYSRACRNRREDDSSAFEHVFVGEHKKDRNTGKISVIGMHNWLAYLTFERQGTWNYYGFKAPRGRRGRNPASDYEKEQVISLVFEWEGQVKPVSTTFMGSSPSFELALYTLSFLCDGGEEKLVPCKMGPYRLGIQVYTYRGGNIGSCHPSDAPPNFDEAAAFIQSRVRGRQERKRVQDKRRGGGRRR